MDILDILGKIGFDWQMALANLVNFLIIFFLVSKFLIKPISKGLNERYERIKDGLKNAEEAKIKLENAENDYNKKIDEAKVDVRGIMDEANKKGEEILNTYKLQAKEEYDSILEDAKIKLKKEKDLMKQEIQKESVDLILTAVEKILKNKIDKKENEKIIKEIFK